MLKEIFKRKKIDEKAQLIAATIVESYPPEIDVPSNEEKSVERKADTKLTNAISKATALTVEISKEMKLGFLGKAKLCKNTQSKLLELGYSMKTAVFIVKNLVVALTSKK